MMKPYLALLLLLPALLLQAEERPTIGISDFTTRFEGTVHKILPNILVENMINSGQFDFFEREKLGAILEEQGFQSSGMVDPQTAVALGRLSGIDYILTGEVVDYGKEVRAFSGYGVRTQTIFYRLEVSTRILETESGRIVFSKTASAEEQQNQGAGIRVVDTTIEARLGRTVADTLSQAILQSPAFKVEEKEPEALARLSVTSEPAKASVEIDGVFYGNAGDTFEVVSGLHNIRVSLPGYEVWDKKVMVRDGASFHVPLVRTSDVRVEIEEDTTISTGSGN